MKKKVKLITTFASLVLALGIMSFGVYAAINQNLVVTSNVNFASTATKVNIGGRVDDWGGTANAARTQYLSSTVTGGVRSNTSTTTAGTATGTSNTDATGTTTFYGYVNNGSVSDVPGNWAIGALSFQDSNEAGRWVVYTFAVQNLSSDSITCTITGISTVTGVNTSTESSDAAFTAVNGSTTALATSTNTASLVLANKNDSGYIRVLAYLSDLNTDITAQELGFTLNIVRS